ncbi:hypothetical protein EYF80_043372 [Liparis tanakae]|uniref:Uncharacterized protein n=1 Tax=Liparis tanakae TaxID=230148 RepID=A0A4Z2G026_9TELE|nr:hypothetical protein EYF80_043372 [Liparis tanakae]
MRPDAAPPGRSSPVLSVSVESRPLAEPSFSLEADLELESSSRFSAALSLAEAPRPAPPGPSGAAAACSGYKEAGPASDEEAGEVWTRGRRDSAPRPRSQPARLKASLGSLWMLSSFTTGKQDREVESESDSGSCSMVATHGVSCGDIIRRMVHAQVPRRRSYHVPPDRRRSYHVPPDRRRSYHVPPDRRRSPPRVSAVTSGPHLSGCAGVRLMWRSRFPFCVKEAPHWLHWNGRSPEDTSGAAVRGGAAWALYAARMLRSPDAPPPPPSLTSIPPPPPMEAQRVCAEEAGERGVAALQAAG